jgi:katanin p60 ATPase-containing subunit A1
LTHGLIVLVFVYWCQQILVPLPEAEARRAMFEELLPSVTSKLEIPYDILVEKTEGYSGSDIRLVCKEAAMQPLRRLMSVLEACDEVVPEEGEFWFSMHLYPKSICI